jgi:hypothetical protein
VRVGEETHTAAGTRAGTRMADGSVSLCFGLGCSSVLEVLAVRLERRHDVELPLWSFPIGGAGPGADRPAVYHDSWTVKPANWWMDGRH